MKRIIFLTFMFWLIPLSTLAKNKTEVTVEALRQGSLKVVRRHINRDNIQPNESLDSVGNTPLIIASRNNQLDIIRFLINNGADPNISNQNAVNPLITATASRYPRVVKYLLENGADPNIIPNPPHKYFRIENPIIHAAAQGYYEILKMLLQHGGNAQIISRHGESPLFVAACEGQTKILQYLIELGGNVNFRVKEDHWTPLMCAVQNNHYLDAHLLLKAGAKPNLTNKKGQSALIIMSRIAIQQTKLTRSTDYQHIIKKKLQDLDLNYVNLNRLLLEYGADPDLQDNQGNTALHYYLDSTRENSIRILINFGANPLLKNDNDVSPLQICLDKNLSNYLSIMLDARIFDRLSLNLIREIQRGNYGSVANLLRNGANPNYETTAGWTPLMHVLRMNSIQFLPLLLKHGANFCMTNKFGLKPTQVAVDRHVRTWVKRQCKSHQFLKKYFGLKFFRLSLHGYSVNNF